jgi:hypothetical protein
MTPGVPYRFTQGAFNNAVAAGDQASRQRSLAGQGLSRGKGQAFRDSVRGGAARADAYNTGMGYRLQDAYSNANLQSQLQSTAANESLALRRLDEQRRMGEWDSRFANLQSAWGALAGLLR